MSFTSKTSRFLLAQAVSCVLTALPLLAAHPQNTSTGASRQEIRGIVVANMDASVTPGDDFYQYTNGGWIKRTEIPPDRGDIDVSTQISELGDTRTVELIQEAAKTMSPLVPAPAKLQDFTTHTWTKPLPKRRASPRFARTSNPLPPFATSANWPVPWVRALDPTSTR